MELGLGLEKAFDIEIADEDYEAMTTVNDIVENIARNFYTKAGGH